ncbi:L-fuconolactonase [Dyadobacter jejuensis]|uniref:L-fuconolactonase n=1 Tax=Dyadobacter jejuensis TaxID=1082580 RepID=A0A316AKS9_9BACT|nr:amidohydrolase family protein [Dyadobacter jejuensis]PWJ58395.1 L-fuconolactonase [Dyadobacter jejuensis]
MYIDSHQHFWFFDPIRDSWITTEMSVIQKNFLPEDLKPILDENGIGGCVAVQASQSDSETTFLLQQAEANEFIKGVVGWIDLKDKDLYDQLDRLTQFEKLKGFRHVVQGEPDGFMLDTQFVKGVRALAAFDFSYDILIYPHQLQEAFEFARQLPEVRMVVDHIAKPYIKKGEVDAWAEGMVQLASLPNVSCKVSGMVTEADWTAWKPSDFTPYLDVVFEAFGPDRLMFGSDWPVCLVAASYKEMKQVLDQYLASFENTDREKIMGGNAAKFYRLELA